jgi:hypothetical protein
VATLGFIAAAGSLFGGLWMLDYLGVTGGYGFGAFKMDALSPVWPHYSALFPWSLRPLEAWEGYNYLGAGLLLGILAVLLLRPAALGAMLARHPGLAAAMAALALFSLSQRPSVGSHELLHLAAVPDCLENLRSTGRFFWPVAYTLLVTTILLIARHPNQKLAAVLLTAVGAMQFADATAMREDLRRDLRAPRADWTVDAPRLRTLLADARSVTLLPTWYCVPPEKDPLPEQALLLETLLLASETAVPASTMDVPRYHGDLRCNDERLAKAPLGRGELRVLTPAAQTAYLRLIPRADELCAPMGRVVACHDPAATGPAPTEPAPPTPLVAGEVRFGPDGAGVALLGRGWSYPEPAGVWSDGNRALLRFERPADLAGPLRLLFEVQGFAPNDADPQRVEIWLDGRKLERWTLPDRQVRVVEVDLPAGPPGVTTLELKVATPVRPADRQLGSDPRRLGVQLHKLRVGAAG